MRLALRGVLDGQRRQDARRVATVPGYAGDGSRTRSHPDHPPSNVLAGARYLRLMLNQFRSTDLALAAYNAGPTAVARAGGAPSAETLTYVANVTRLWAKLDSDCK